MSHHTSESLICELSEKVRRTAERHPKQKLTVQAILKTASDRTKPVEYRKQLLLQFLNRHREVEDASY